MLKKFFSFMLVGAMLMSFMSPLVLATEGEVDSTDDEMESEVSDDASDDSSDDSMDELDDSGNDSVDDLDDDSDDSSGESMDDDEDEEEDEFDSDDLEDDVTESGEVSTDLEVDADEDDADEITEAITEELSLDDFDEDDLDETTEIWTASDYADLLHVGVRWGFFGENMGLNATALTADGEVNFEGESVGFPEKLLRWERRRDSIIYDETDAHGTAFESEIVGYNDGILFKTKTNLDASAEMTYTDEQIDETISISFTDLVADEDGEIVFTFENNYQVVFNVWDREEWLSSTSEKISVRADDAELGAWYHDYMKFVVDKGFFNGYADDNGHLTGMMGPADNLTRFQAIKVVSELANELDTGLGETACDPLTVTETSETDWMGDHWARGYVQCIEDSGIETTLLNDVIKEDVLNGQLPALRIEVVVLIYELLELPVDETADSELTDLQLIESDFRDMVESSVELGIISGYPDGRFRPYNRVNRAEMFKIINLFYEVLSLEA